MNDIYFLDQKAIEKSLFKDGIVSDGGLDYHRLLIDLQTYLDDKSKVTEELIDPCEICYGNLKNRIITTCGHRYCDECLAQTKGECFFCRKPFDPNTNVIAC